MSKSTSDVNPQSLQRTPTWTNPMKFLQNIRYKHFLTKDKQTEAERGEKPKDHEALHKRISYHLDEIEKKHGARSLKHHLVGDLQQ